MIQLDQISIPSSAAGSLLGAGGTANVLRGLMGGEEVAVKVLVVLDLTVEVIKSFLREAALLKAPPTWHCNAHCSPQPQPGRLSPTRIWSS